MVICHSNLDQMEEQIVCQFEDNYITSKSEKTLQKFLTYMNVVKINNFTKISRFSMF